MIEIENLTVQFGGVRPIDGLSVRLDEPVVGLIGPNGAGKTTLLNVLSGFVTPVSGTVRVDGKDVRARVVAEGGNLGFTQKGRLEYWSAGDGGINTDAVDNSGGVDMSDHEVNIKILMDILVKRGVVRGRGERNHILMEMTEEVAELVLADNRNQARALTLDGRRSVKRYEEFAAFVEDLVGAGVRLQVLLRVGKADSDVWLWLALVIENNRELASNRSFLPEDSTHLVVNFVHHSSMQALL